MSKELTQCHLPSVTLRERHTACGAFSSVLCLLANCHILTEEGGSFGGESEEQNLSIVRNFFSRSTCGNFQLLCVSSGLLTQLVFRLYFGHHSPKSVQVSVSKSNVCHFGNYHVVGSSTPQSAFLLDGNFAGIDVAVLTTNLFHTM